MVQPAKLKAMDNLRGRMNVQLKMPFHQLQAMDAEKEEHNQSITIRDDHEFADISSDTN